MLNFIPCPMPTYGAPINAVHLVPQGMGAFTYVIRCDCGLSFDTGAQSEATAADRWNEQPAPASEPKPVEDISPIALVGALEHFESEGEDFVRLTDVRDLVAMIASPASKPAETGSLIAEQSAFQQWIMSQPKDPLHWETWMARAKLNGAPK